MRMCVCVNVREGGRGYIVCMRERERERERDRMLESQRELKWEKKRWLPWYSGDDTLAYCQDHLAINMNPGNLQTFFQKLCISTTNSAPNCAFESNNVGALKCNSQPLRKLGQTDQPTNRPTNGYKLHSCPAYWRVVFVLIMYCTVLHLIYWAR